MKETPPGFVPIMERHEPLIYQPNQKKYKRDKWYIRSDKAMTYFALPCLGLFIVFAILGALLKGYFLGTTFAIAGMVSFAVFVASMLFCCVIFYGFTFIYGINDVRIRYLGTGINPKYKWPRNED